MAEPDREQEDTSAPDGRSEAQKYLDVEFVRCRDALVPRETGTERMREGQRAFDEAWAGIVKNAVRLFGRGATREALERMARPEDASKMY